MALRLSHVLVLMALVLAAGVLSAHHLQADAGASVPGLILVEAPQLDAAALQTLANRLAPADAGFAQSGAEAFAPFDAEFVRRRAGEGAATVLVSALPRDADAPHRDWRVVIADPPGAEGVSGAARAAASALGFVAGQAGVRAFVLGFDPGPVAEPMLAALLSPLLEVADALPRVRRTSLVILGARNASGQRDALRIDRGAWGRRARPALADLLEDAW